MPCMTSDGGGYGPSYSDLRRLEERIERLEKGQPQDVMLSRFLCGICSALVQLNSLEVLLRHVDWKQAGTTRAEFERWWAAHKNADSA